MRRPIIIAAIVFVVIVVLALIYTLFLNNKTKLPKLSYSLVEETSFSAIQVTSNGVMAVRSSRVYVLNTTSHQFEQLGSVRTGDIRVSNDGNYVSSSNGNDTIIYNRSLQTVKTLPSNFFGWVGNGTYIYTPPKPFVPGTDVIPATLENILLGSVQNTVSTKVASTTLPYYVIASSETDVLLASGLNDVTVVNKINLASKSAVPAEQYTNPGFARSSTSSLAAMQNDPITSPSSILLYQADGKRSATGMTVPLSNTFVESEQVIYQASTNDELTLISSYAPAAQASTQLYQIPYVMPKLQNLIKYKDVLIFNTIGGVIISTIPGDSK